VRQDLFRQVTNTGGLAGERVSRVWSVSQVNALAREVLEGAFPPLWVAGEVSGFKRYPSGHCYFTLKDETGQLGCVMWRDAARALPAEPPEGMAVHVFGYLTLYERAGRFQLVVRELTAHGEGLWRVAFERARKELEAEGLLDPARKRPLPAYPSCVGVVTSIEGAAVRDIVSIIRRRAPWTDILIYPTRVQGDGAAESIVAALRHAGQAARADVLIVGRGGGSVEDLRAFNDEVVARAIARSPLPVISAVGHETDVTLADLVADYRAATPSAAAEIAVPDRDRLRTELANAGERVATALSSGVTRGRQRIERLEQQLLKAMGDALQRHRLVIGGLRHRLQALGPMEVLRRGYALALDERGHVLRRVADFRRVSTFVLRLRDGRVEARAERVSEEV
jgi:exodeoxyribonuclease VII large subunit